MLINGHKCSLSVVIRCFLFHSVYCNNVNNMEISIYLSIYLSIYTIWLYSLWITLENTDDSKVFLFAHHPTRILAKLSTRCFEHSGEISCSLIRATLMIPGKDKTRVCRLRHSEFIHLTLWRTLMRTEYFLFVYYTTSIWKNSTSDALSYLVTSVVLYSFTRATLMSPGKDEILVCGYRCFEYIH